MFQVITPEFATEISKVVDKLKRPVQELNKNLHEFSRLVNTGFVRFPQNDLEMPEDYNRDFHEWVQNGALEDFITKMASEYKHFDIDRHAEKGGDPNKFVKTKKRKVILGGLGSIWIDIPLVGTVDGTQVTKWTRASFVYTNDKWTVFFDPTGDDCSFRQAEESKKYAKSMLSGCIDVDLDS